MSHITVKSNKSWKALFMKFLCTFIYCGHNLADGPNGHKYCLMCGEKFFNKAELIHKERKSRHNKWGKKFF